MSRASRYGNPVRNLFGRVIRGDQSPSRGGAEAPPAMTILDQYCTKVPTAQNALDIFAGEWASRLPSTCGALQAGINPLFTDPRLAWGLQALGGVQNQNVLELGPLEAGHSWMLEQTGAASITAIEANTRAYLKCLVVKEVVGLHRTHFLCGDFVEFLHATNLSFDLVVASGVLYHMLEPAQLIGLLSQTTDRLFLWTHYYQEDVIRGSQHLSSRFKGTAPSEYQGFRSTVYRQEYASALSSAGFCGGANSFSHWMSRDDILRCLRYFGFRKLQIAFDDPLSANGPSFAIAARRGPLS